VAAAAALAGALAIAALEMRWARRAAMGAMGAALRLEAETAGLSLGGDGRLIDVVGA
jgi:hypothetical protein